MTFQNCAKSLSWLKAIRLNLTWWGIVHLRLLFPTRDALYAP